MSFPANTNSQPAINTPSVNQGFSFGTGMNFITPNSQQSNSKSADPFDDLL
jgi:hypothetical protein